MGEFPHGIFEIGLSVKSGAFETLTTLTDLLTVLTGPSVEPA